MYKKIIIIPPEKIKMILSPNQTDLISAAIENKGAVDKRRIKAILKGFWFKKNKIINLKKSSKWKVRILNRRGRKPFFC